MKLYNFISKSIYIFIATVSSLLLASCGSYQYTGNSNDGIYGNTEQIAVPAEIEYGTREENTGYYKKLFEEEAALYGEVLAEDAVFTDVDSYSSTGNYDYDNQNSSNYQGGNAPWGNSPDSYSINIYNDGFYGGFYDPFWGRGYNYGFANQFWGPSFYGPGFYGNPYYNPFYGFGYGYGYGIGFSAHPFIYGGGGWYNPYQNFYSRQHNFRQNVAYNSGRRGGSYSSSNRTNAIRNATTLDNRGRSSTYSRSIRNIRNSNDDYGISRRTSSREYSTRVNSDGTYSRSSRNSSVNSPTRRSSNSTYSRSSSPSRNSSSTVRSSNSGRSSSSAGRSSSGSSSRSSSSSSNRGRGNR